MTLDELDEAWHVLTERQKTVLTKRFGLNDRKPETLEAIGKELGITRQAILYHQAVAIRKLRRAGHELHLHDKIPAFLIPKVSAKPAVKRKKKPKPKTPPLPKYTDAQRLDWLEHAIHHRDMKLSAAFYGMTIYIDGKGESLGRDLRAVLDSAMKKNPLPA